MSRRYIYAVLGILTATAAYMCWCRAPLIWDGAPQLRESLYAGVPYHYLTRFHTLIIWWPAVWASHFTHNLTVISALYGLPFLLAPVVAVGVSWWLVKNEAPHLIIWPIFGVAAGTLPGQIFVINDSIFQLNLFWPVLMALFVTLSPAKRIMLVMIGVFQFVHQIGVILFFGAAIVAAIVAVVDVQNRRRFAGRSVMMLSLFCLAMSKVILTNTRPPHRDLPGVVFAFLGAALFVAAIAMSFGRRSILLSTLPAIGLVLALQWTLRVHKPWVDSLLDTYAEQEAGLLQALANWVSGVMGWPIRGLCLMYTCGILVLLHHSRQQSGKSTPKLIVVTGLAAFLCATLALACWIHWASNGRLWWKALDYRRWAVPLTTPFFILLMIEVCITAESNRREIVAAPQFSRSLRGPLALLLAATFAIVLSLQSTIFHNMSRRLYKDVSHPLAEREKIPPEGTVAWMRQSPIDHWGSVSLMLLMEEESAEWTPKPKVEKPVGKPGS